MLEAFWPISRSGERFQPEPGCSEPTFIGSNADLAGLSARMLNSVARAIAKPSDPHTGAGWLFEESGPVHAFAWHSDYHLRDKGRGYSIRASSHAVREMRGWARRSVRTAGATIETGGLVFGELNEAAGVLWVTDVEGPPPDSHAGEDHFTCGIEGMAEAAREKHCRFRGSVDCVGSWHTHPTSTPHPSDVDIGAVGQLLAGSGSSRRTCLVLILSGNPGDPTLGAYAFRTKLSGEGLYPASGKRGSDSAPRATTQEITERGACPLRRRFARDRVPSRMLARAARPRSSQPRSGNFERLWRVGNLCDVRVFQPLVS